MPNSFVIALAEDGLVFTGGVLYLLYFVLVLGIGALTLLLPIFVWRMARNVKRIALAQEETNKLLRELVAKGRGVVVHRVP